jgi:hypothetical protein
LGSKKCFASIQKITSQTIRISGALVFLCTGATPCPKIYNFIIVYCFLIVFNLFQKLSMQKMSQEHRQRSAKIRKCCRFKLVPKLQLYSCLDISMVRASACNSEMVGVACSIPGKFIIFTLGLSPSQDEM